METSDASMATEAGTVPPAPSPAPESAPVAESAPNFWARWFGPLTIWRVFGIVVAFAFLGGTIGWVLRDREVRTAHNGVDAGFARDMLAHHDQAVVMALTVMDDPAMPRPVADAAREVVVFQRYEIGLFDDSLARWNERRDGGGVSMRWMGEPVPSAEMPGLATDAELATLAKAKGNDAAALFIAVMSRHHLGGIAMAKYEAAHGKDSLMRNIARSIAADQTAEIREYSQMRVRFNLAVPPGFSDPPSLKAAAAMHGMSHDGGGG